MPHTTSAKKRLRQAIKRNAYNRAYKKSIKDAIKAFNAAMKGDSAEQKTATFKAAVKRLDKAAARRVIHPNKAARKKAQLAAILTATKPATEKK